MPNSLSLALAESALFLRAVHVHRTPSSHDNAPPAILRGLLVLSLAKPTRISSIQAELVAESVTIWTGGQSSRYPAELQERNNLYSATRTFFQAPRITTGRRSLSLDPGLSHYADQDEFTSHTRHSSPSLTRERQFNPIDIPRGRERARPRVDDDEHTSQYDPQGNHLHSLRALDTPSPISSENDDLVPPLYSPHLSPPHHFSTAGESPRVPDDILNERPRSESRGRRRMSARFSLASVSSSILQAMRSVSGTSKECRGEDHSPFSRHRGEAFGLDGNEQGPDDFGDGWQEFKKGTYTFPISFVIPSHMPPTLKCDYGSVAWRLKATVHRPGPFTPKLTASRDVILVASLNEDDREDVDNVTIERHWEDQMQYMLTVSGRVFPIGGTVPITLTLLPMAKVKIFELTVHLEERVDYYFTFSPTACRKDPKRRFVLLSLKSKDENIPLLPLPETVTSVTDHPLHSLLKADDNASKLMANLMGYGPWTFPMALALPSSCGTLHFSNKNKRAPIEITHTLKVTIRAQRGDDQQMDSETGKRKQFDIVMRMPVHILSSLSNVQHTALPCYSESANAPPSSPAPAPPCVSFEDHRYSQPNPRRSSAPPCQIPSGVLTPFTSFEARTPSGMDSFYERNVTFERLITGQQREDGVAPPAYALRRD